VKWRGVSEAGAGGNKTNEHFDWMDDVHVNKMRDDGTTSAAFPFKRARTFSINRSRSDFFGKSMINHPIPLIRKREEWKEAISVSTEEQPYIAQMSNKLK
jgi:hypothetical protein